MNALDEQRFWDSLDDESARINTEGDPPYDLVPVVLRLVTAAPDAQRILDLGCGRGRVTNAVARLMPAATVYGVDISIKMLDAAAVMAGGVDNVHYWRTDGRTIPQFNNRDPFDLVYSIATYQHIPNDAMWGYIHQVHERLAPSGVFMFTIAVGESDHFLNHQIPDPRAFGADLIQIFDHVSIDAESDGNGWTWVTARKASQ